MANQDNIRDELRNLDSGLPVNNSQNPFSIPEGYFDGLAASILAKVTSQTTSASDELKELSPFLAGLSREMPYSVPTGYFEQHPEILSGMLGEKESPVLAYIGKELPYHVPYDYFDHLPEQVLAKVARSQAKVVPLFARKWMKMAAAAVVGGALVLAGYQYFGKTDEASTLAQTPADTTSQTLVAQNKAAVEEQIEQVSTKELDEFINTVQLNPAKEPPAKATSSDKKQMEEVRTLLKDVPASEIDAFLNQIPTADEELLVID